MLIILFYLHIFHNLFGSDLFTEKVDVIIIVGNTRNRKLDTVARDNKMALFTLCFLQLFQ